MQKEKCVEHYSHKEERQHTDEREGQGWHKLQQVSHSQWVGGNMSTEGKNI